MTAGLTLRPLLTSDQAAWRGLWLQYLDFYETTLAVDVFETAFARLISPDAREFSGLLALSNGVAVGLAHYLFHRNLWALEDTCYLMDLFVTPNLRGQGVGRALIHAVQDRAQNSGTKGLYWMTQEFNTPGRRLYDTMAQKSDFIVYEMPDRL